MKNLNLKLNYKAGKLYEVRPIEVHWCGRYEYTVEQVCLKKTMNLYGTLPIGNDEDVSLEKFLLNIYFLRIGCKNMQGKHLWTKDFMISATYAEVMPAWNALKRYLPLDGSEIEGILWDLGYPNTHSFDKKIVQGLSYHARQLGKLPKDCKQDIRVTGVDELELSMAI